MRVNRTEKLYGKGPLWIDREKILNDNMDLRMRLDCLGSDNTRILRRCAQLEIELRKKVKI